MLVLKRKQNCLSNTKIEMNFKLISILITFYIFDLKFMIFQWIIYHTTPELRRHTKRRKTIVSIIIAHSFFLCCGFSLIICNSLKSYVSCTKPILLLFCIYWDFYSITSVPFIKKCLTLALILIIISCVEVFLYQNSGDTFCKWTEIWMGFWHPEGEKNLETVFRLGGFAGYNKHCPPTYPSLSSFTIVAFWFAL